MERWETLMAQKIFITGTDTGVGKTVFTAFLLWFMRNQGLKALAMKPFCSGGREDAQLLNRLQGSEVSLDWMNPFYFDLPCTPLIAARVERKEVRIESALKAIDALESRCDVLLIEGAGGLLSPLGERFSLLEIIKVKAEAVYVVAKNKLGTINHVLLTEEVLKQNGVLNAQFVLMDGVSKLQKDGLETTNLGLLDEFLGENRICSIKYLGKNPCKSDVFKKHAKYFEKTVAPFLGVGRLIAVERRGSATKR
jgi:dethiobiotin synthetase